MFYGQSLPGRVMFVLGRVIGYSKVIQDGFILDGGDEGYVKGVIIALNDPGSFVDSFHRGDRFPGKINYLNY